MKFVDRLTRNEPPPIPTGFAVALNSTARKIGTAQEGKDLSTFRLERSEQFSQFLGAVRLFGIARRLLLK